MGHRLVKSAADTIGALEQVVVVADPSGDIYTPPDFGDKHIPFAHALFLDSGSERDMAVDGSGTPVEYTVAPPDASGQVWRVAAIKLSILSESGGWKPDEFTNKNALSSGLLLKHCTKDEQTAHWSMNFQDNIDLMSLTQEMVNSTFQDGKQLLSVVIKPESLTMRVTDVEKLSLLVRDNLTIVSSMRATVVYGVE